MVPLVPPLGSVCGVGDGQLRDQRHLPGVKAGPPHRASQSITVGISFQGMRTIGPASFQQVHCLDFHWSRAWPKAAASTAQGHSCLPATQKCHVMPHLLFLSGRQTPSLWKGYSQQQQTLLSPAVFSHPSTELQQELKTFAYFYLAFFPISCRKIHLKAQGIRLYAAKHQAEMPLLHKVPATWPLPSVRLFSDSSLFWLHLCCGGMQVFPLFPSACPCSGF